MQPQQQQPKNYLKGQKGQQHQQAGASNNKSRVLVRQLPDQTIHNPPGAFYVLGVLGILAGIGANVWQIITTFTAFWGMFNPAGTPVDVGKQPAIFIICGMMAFSFQMALMMLVFRLDSSWKKHKVKGQAPGTEDIVSQARATAIEIVQHINLVVIWGALGFVVNTVGDYVFVSSYTGNLDPITSTFLIFCYAVALYALSTIAFVRSIEYLWAAFAAAENLQREREQQQQQREASKEAKA